MVSIVKEICQRRGWSKYKLAKEMGVSWNTIHLWDKEIWKPKIESQKKLEEILRWKDIG